MSEQNNPKPMERAWHFYLDDIIGFAGNVLTCTANLSQAEFEQSQLHYDATAIGSTSLSKAGGIE